MMVNFKCKGVFLVLGNDVKKLKVNGNIVVFFGVLKFVSIVFGVVVVLNLLVVKFDKEKWVVLFMEE